MCPNCGGNWDNSSNAGVWSLNLNNSRANSNDNYGFRSDSDSPRTMQMDGGSKGDVFPRLGQLIAKSAAHLFPSSGRNAIESLGVAP